MEVEVKLRLAGPEAHATLAAALAPHYRTTHKQENFFFDGPNQELSSRRVVLRVRFYNKDKKALVTLKVRSLVVELSLVTRAPPAPAAGPLPRLGARTHQVVVSKQRCIGTH